MSFDWSFDYPVTLELSRRDVETGRDWLLVELEVEARIGQGPEGWKLESRRCVCWYFNTYEGSWKVEEDAFTGQGADPLDLAVEGRLRDHLRREHARIDDLWDAHVRECNAVMQLRISPGGKTPSSSLKRPELPPSSPTVTMAVML